MTKVESVRVASIRRDGGTQLRAALNNDQIDRLHDAREAGIDLPPVVVFYDGTTYWLADGFHRVEVYDARDEKTIRAEVHEGTQRDAILYACGANTSHGLPRSNKDKRRAVLTLLKDKEWGSRSVNWIADSARVSDTLVRSIGEEIGINFQKRKLAATDGKDGKTRNVENIGRTPRCAARTRKSRAKQIIAKAPVDERKDLVREVLADLPEQDRRDLIHEVSLSDETRASLDAGHADVVAGRVAPLDLHALDPISGSCVPYEDDADGAIHAAKALSAHIELDEHGSERLAEVVLKASGPTPAMLDLFAKYSEPTPEPPDDASRKALEAIKCFDLTPAGYAWLAARCAAMVAR